MQNGHAIAVDPAVRSLASEISRRHNLYGRDQQVSHLLEGLDRTTRGRAEVLLLPGLSGAGKTALANTLRGPARAQNGFFLEGKFNQYDQNVAYVAWRQALGEFCNFVGREEQAVRDRWAAEILEAVAGQGQLLIDLVPEFERLLGKQAPVDTISPQESRHRFAGVIRDTLAVIAQPEHPLVLFIDDWQWADPASLHLLTQLQFGSTLRYVLLVAAYRSDEVEAGHGFHSTVAELRSQQIPLSTTPVENLTSAELQRLVAAEQEIDACEARALAEDVFRATGGNAFFAHVLLGAIRSDNHPADCEPTAARATLGTDVPTSVVDLFTRRISGLPERTQELLSLAACLGHRFDLDTLAMIGGWSIDECQSGLAPARGMLTPLSDKVPRVSGKWFRFAHDRVQQAAFSRIPPGDLAAIRLMIARQMLAHLSTADADERVCEIADHFNAGAGLIDSEPERLRGVELNMHAARKARNATAFRSALAFHRAARTLLASGDALPRFWRQRHDTALALHLEHAETEFLEGDQGEAEELIRQAVQNAQTPTQRADALTALVVQHTLQARYGDAIATGREALATIGFELPDERFEEARDTAIQETQRLMEGRSVDDIVGMPLASDQVMQTAAKILITMGPPCYRAHQRLWSVIVPRVVNLTLQYGHIPQIGYSHPAMAGLLGWVSDDFESGRVYCKIASRLMNPDLAPASDQSVYHLMMGSSARHWYGPLSESTEDYLAAIESGRASGNLQYAAYSLGHNMYCRFFQGTPLAELTAETEGALSFSRTRHNQWAIDLLRGGLRVFGALAGGTPADASEYWEAAYLQEVESHHNQQVACIYYVLKAQQCLLRGDADASHGYLQKAEPLIATVGTQGLLPWPEYVFTRAMTTAMSAGGAAGPLSSEQDAEAESLTSQLRVWAEQCPQNFRHKHLLVLAERAAAEGRRRDAMGLLDEAVDAAKESGFVHWEGFANRRAADLWGAIGNGRLQQVYWQRAYDCFGRWGAQGIIDGIDAEYHQSVMAAARDLDSCEAAQTQAEEHQHQRFAKRHLGLLRESAAQLEQARQQQHVAETAEELATAADSLRVDVATGRRTVTKLRKQRKAEQALNQELECRVAERTAELEATSKELQLSERLFRTSVEAAPVGMVMINDEGAIVLANSSLCHLFGYKREELVGESIELLVPHACRTPHGSLQEDGFREPDPRLLGVGRDLFGKHKHGTLIPIEFGLTPITLEDGAGAIGTVVDLTARKRAEDSLRESEERHRLVVDGVKDYSIISLDPAGAITTWNSGAERILGYCADEILGRHSSSFHPGDAVEAGQAELELSIAAAEGRFEDEGWRVRKDGKPFWANVVITAIRDSQGTLVGYSKITRDLTERRRAEQALEDANFSLAESQALLRTLIDESMNFKGVMTPDGTLIDANRTALTAAGVDAQDVLNRPFADTPWWSHSPELQQRLSEAILSVASGEADRFDATHLDPAGNVLHVDFSLKPVRNDAGEVIYLIPEGRDMTLHKQREEELHRLIEEVRRSNDELEQFAYVASHDLQEPLRKIASYCKLLKEEQSDKLDEEGNEYLDVAINGAKRLQTLVRDLLTFSRITTRGKPLTATSASASFADATTNLSMLIEERAAVITCEALPDVVADSGQLTHLFQNLIGNAIKYCDHQAPEIHVGVRDAGRAVEFFVRDNGIGIDPVFHEKIFQVFQRLHNRREYGGTGIGLALCKRIVERFGGSIRVESTAGAGSTFYFTTSKAEHENRADVPTRHAAPVGAAN